MFYFIWWRGWGIAVLPLAIGIPAGIVALTEKCLGDNYWLEHGWPLGSGLALAAAAVWLLGVKVNGLETVADAEHTLFSVPVQYWGYILAAASAIAWVTIALG